MGKVRFVFGKEMTDKAMREAFKKFAQKVGFKTKDTHKPEKKVKKSRK
jgi:hypothetical protein